MNPIKPMLLLVALSFVSLVLAGCTQPQQQAQAQTGAVVAGSNTPLPSETTTASATPTATPAPEVKEFAMTARQFAFDPDTITVKKGDRVKIIITDVDVVHGFALPDFGVSVELNPGESKAVEFTADKAGTFFFFCNVPCGSGHREMQGKLVVQES